jgi:hypothetical protein
MSSLDPNTACPSCTLYSSTSPELASVTEEIARSLVSSDTNAVPSVTTSTVRSMWPRRTDVLKSAVSDRWK